MKSIPSSDIRSTSSGNHVHDEWEEIAASSQFQTLIKKKKAFLIPTIVFFMVYYFALPIMAGYFKTLMSKDIPIFVNFGYLFAVSQFIMAWILAFLYMKRADRFDEIISEIYTDKKRGLKS